MKKCEKCGWVTGNPADSFCEKCGGRLTEMPEKEAGDSQGKKGVLPIIAGCAAVAVLLIAGTVIGIRMMGDGNRERAGEQPDNLGRKGTGCTDGSEQRDTDPGCGRGRQRRNPGFSGA